ncbi:MAG: hypothetical protein FJ096_15325 [Deltaproteobacteria bacterium]|nr:hypothetical protein [Deltaproteobacteria bacterium]
MWSILRKLSFVALLATAHAALGCAPPPPQVKRANVEPGSMPADGEWSGVYFSPLFGTLHLATEGNLVRGKWLRPLKGEWGQLKGNVDGNLLRFDWDEYKDGLVGPNSRLSGKGYFLYTRPAGDNVDDVLKGEMGRGSDEAGIEWVAVKQRNVKPDLDSIGGAGASDVGGGDWDKGSSESGEVESPATTTE